MDMPFIHINKFPKVMALAVRAEFLIEVAIKQAYNLINGKDSVETMLQINFVFQGFTYNGIIPVRGGSITFSPFIIMVVSNGSSYPSDRIDMALRICTIFLQL